MDVIPEIDYFFEADTKKYLDSLKYFDSRKSSANFSTGANLERTSANITLMPNVVTLHSRVTSLNFIKI